MPEDKERGRVMKKSLTLLLILAGILMLACIPCIFKISKDYNVSTKKALELLYKKYTKEDTDKDGISDFDEETTSFCYENGKWIKIPRKEAIKYSYSNCKYTDPNKKDSDGDGLGDYDEINDYGTCPVDEDTDRDGIDDKYEILHGLNPLKKDENLYEIIKRIKNTNYVPRSIRDILPESYEKNLREKYKESFLDSILNDGKIDEKEINAFKLLTDLPPDVQKFYFEEKGLGENTINYLYSLSTLENKSLAKYAAENLLGFADGNLERIEREFLENPDLYLKEIKKHYSEKLEKIPELREQIEELPEYKLNSLKTIEALEDIAFLVEKAEPYEKFEDRFDSKKITPAREVYEAFELMIKGGIPDQSDFNYSVPNYNTELQCLWWLAEENEFKEYDTLAQAIAMDHGLFVTMGTEEVRKAVKKDINEFLRFGRETSEWQRALNLSYNLEEYPLEAKIAWAWRGGLVHSHGTYCIYGPSQQCKHFLLEEKLSERGYRWFSVRVKTMSKMRKHFLENKLILPSDLQKLGIVVDKLEDYFYFSGRRLHWERCLDWNVTIEINGETVPARNYGNVEYVFDRYLKTGRALGVCMEEALLIENIVRSYGIAPVQFLIYWMENGNTRMNGHGHILYYDPDTSSWKGSYYQTLEDLYDAKKHESKVDTYIAVPVILQGTIKKMLVLPENIYVKIPYQTHELNVWGYKPVHLQLDSQKDEIKFKEDIYLKGILSLKVKKLYLSDFWF